MYSFWQNIDKIIYINIDYRKDRNEHVLKELSELGVPSEKIERLEAVKHPKGYIGCSMSHIECLKLAIERNYDSVLILEDDVIFKDKEYFKNISEKIFNQNFDVFMLGVNIEKYEYIDENFTRVINGLSLVGYIVKNHYFHKLLNSFETSLKLLLEKDIVTHYSVDGYLRYYVQPYDQWLTFSKLNVSQLPGYSDIEKREVNYDFAMLKTIYNNRIYK